MHVRSGLAAAAVGRGSSRTLVGAGLANILPLGHTLHLAGNSVHFDRGFLARYWPGIASLFHHRHLDVSSIRMLGERVTSAPQLAVEKPHRAMQDVRRSIAELRHWRDALRS
jgi:oligoribonuclease